MNTQKPLSDRDANQTLQSSYNQVDGSLQISGFLTGRVGHKVEFATTTTSTTDDTQIITFSDNGNELYELTLIYTDATQQTLISAERTA